MKYIILLLVSISMGSDTDLILDKLSNHASIDIVNTEITSEYTLQEINWNDKNVPLSIGILEGNYTDKMIFLLAAGNYGLEFMTNAVETMAFNYMNKGYLVVMISPRIDNVTEVKKRLRRWGVGKRVKDAHKVIKRVRKVIDLDYNVGGFSYGAFDTFVYAAEKPDCRFKEAHILGVDSYNDSAMIEFATNSYLAAVDSLDNGVYVDSSVSQFRDFVGYVGAFPDDPSGVPGFTNEQLLYFVLTNPDGVDLALQQNAAGDFNALTHFSLETLVEAASKFNSALIPWAEARDFYAAASYIDPIDFESITAKVIYVNGALGYGHFNHWASLVDSSEVHVIPGYGHLDLVLGDSANVDVWSKF